MRHLHIKICLHGRRKMFESQKMSDAMKSLQSKVNVSPDGSYGPNTARAIAKYYNLSPNRGAHLLGQCSHESAGFTRTTEGLYYSTPERIQAVWPSRFPTPESAAPYAKNPAKLANRVYADRMSNGDEASGDGSLYAGRGFLQITGKYNYRKFASDMGTPEVMTDPDLCANKYALDTAIWFFQENDLYHIADEGVSEAIIKKITKRVNGGHHGLSDRIEKTLQAHGWLSDT